MEGFYPDAGSVVEMGQRAVDFGVSMVVAARHGEPAVGAQIICVEADGGDGVAGASGALLVEAAQQLVPFVPGEERLKESNFGQGGAHLVEIVAQLVGCWPASVVAFLCGKGAGKVCSPGGERRQLVLEGPDDHLSEEVGCAAFKFAVHAVEQVGAAFDAEIVESSAYGVGEADAPFWSAVGGGSAIDHREGVGGGRRAGRPRPAG